MPAPERTASTWPSADEIEKAASQSGLNSCGIGERRADDEVGHVADQAVVAELGRRCRQAVRLGIARDAKSPSE